MLRQTIALTLLAALAAPAAAQVSPAKPDTLRYSISTRSEGWLGMGISCSRCSLTTSDEGGGRRWTFSARPAVFSVDDNGPADRAGIRTGDTLVSIDGLDLTTLQGGAAFGSVKPGQEVTLRFRRDAQEQEVRLVAGSRPFADRRDLEMATRALRRAQEAQEREVAQSRERLERSRAEWLRVQAEVQAELQALSHRQSRADSEQLARVQRLLAEQQRLLARAMTLRALRDSAGHAVPLLPGEAPAAPAPPVEGVPAPAPAPLPPMSYREHRGFGPLRHSGRLGDVIIEARGPGGVTATEVSDSEVVVTSGDLSVRLAIRPRSPAKPAPRPRPARPPEN